MSTTPVSTNTIDPNEAYRLGVLIIVLVPTGVMLILALIINAILTYCIKEEPNREDYEPIN